MTIAKALKYRKRLVQSIAKLDENLSSNNSVIEGNTRDHDPRKLLEERKRLVEHLVAVKVVIYKANFPIQEKIFRISELKGLITRLGAIDTKHGKQEPSWRATTTGTVYQAEIKKVEVDEMVAALEEEIDKLQEELDKYNYNTEIEIETLPGAGGQDKN